MRKIVSRNVFSTERSPLLKNSREAKKFFEEEFTVQEASVFQYVCNPLSFIVPAVVEYDRLTVPIQIYFNHDGETVTMKRG